MIEIAEGAEKLERQRAIKREYMRRKRQDPQFTKREKFLREHSDVRLRAATQSNRCHFCERIATMQVARMVLGRDDWEESNVPYCGVC